MARAVGGLGFIVTFLAVAKVVTGENLFLLNGLVMRQCPDVCYCLFFAERDTVDARGTYHLKGSFMRIAKVFLVMVLAALFSTIFLGCTSTEAPDERVAATVNGVDIMEADVTARIEALRLDQTTGEPLDDVAWAKLLDQNSFTPETLREYVIRNEFGFYLLFLQKAAEVGVVPNEDAVEQTMASVRSNVESSSMSFEDYLKSMGLSSEDSYRRMLEANDVKDEAVEKLMKIEPPSQDEIDAYISENAAMYAGKRLSLIVLSTDANDPDKSEDAVRAQVKDAHKELVDGADFATVAKKYMPDTQLGEAGGDLGWGYENYAPQEVQDALKGLKKNEVSKVVEIASETPVSTEDTEDADGDTPQTVTNYTFYIVTYTDNFKLTDAEKQEPVDVKKVPDELIKELTDDFTSQQDQIQQDKFFTDMSNSDEIVVNPMPEGLSYDVDMSKAKEPAEEENADGTEGSEGSTPPEDQTPAVNPFEGEEVPEPTFDKNGLGISDISKGTGPKIKKGDVALVHYIGYLEDGTVFDSSFNRGEPFEVTVGAGQVIKGWDLGLIGMKVGGHRELIIPPDLAYGEQGTGSGSIPPNATLRFDIELVSVNGDSTGYAGSEG